MEGLSCPRHSASVRQHALAQGDHPHFRPHPHPHLHPHLHLHPHPRHHCQHPGPSKQAILLSSSMLSLSQFKSQSAIGDHVSEVAPPGGQGETSEASSDSGPAGRGGMWLLVLDPAFLALCLASALIQLACMVPLFFVADFAASLQMDRDRAALLIGVYGVCNMVGRAGAGGLATLRQVNVLALQFLGLALAGTACLLLPLCTSFPPLLAAFSVLFGVSIGFFPPLQPLLLVEYFSLEQLTSSLGLLSMVKGIATIVGPPIAGGLFEASKDYNHSFLAAGGALYLSAGVHLLMPLARRLQGRARSPATSDSGQPASSPCACSSSDSGHPASSPCTSSHSDST